MKTLSYKKTAYIISILCFVIGILCFIVFFIKDNSSNKVVDANVDIPPVSNSNNIEENSEPQEPEPEKQDIEVNVMMVGDNLLHMPVVNSGLKSDGSYNFDHLFENIKDDLEWADVKIINQETILGGTEMGLSEYPQFNSPQEVGDAIAKAGFNVVMHANNHTMDRGYTAVENTLNFWDKYPNITVVGVNKTEADKGRIRIKEVEGVKIAILSYTTSLNGIAMPKDKPWLVDMFDEDQIKADLTKAKELSDFIIVLPHWGNEYSYSASGDQKYYAQLMCDYGADLIIGTHPHVIQPIEVLEGDSGHSTLVYYSLGNYVSNQGEPPRMLGGMAKVTLLSNEQGVSIKDSEIELLVTHFEAGNAKNTYGVHKLKDYTETMASVHGVKLKQESSQKFSLEFMKNLAKEVLGDWYKV